MYWKEDSDNKQEYQVPDRIVDVVFSMTCKCIPMENAYLLSESLQQALPWLAEEKGAGIHPVHGAESGNGWERPDTELLHLSRRQKLIIRIPKTRLGDIEKLVGETLDIGGFPLNIEKFTTKKLSDLPTLFSKGIAADAGQSEDEFMQQVVEQLGAMGIKVQKMMCGKVGEIELPDRTLYTRSLMLADLDKEESVLLQEEGLGSWRKLGCGLFLPQKGIKAVNAE